MAIIRTNTRRSSARNSIHCGGSARMLSRVGGTTASTRSAALRLRLASVVFNVVVVTEGGVD